MLAGLAGLRDSGQGSSQRGPVTVMVSRDFGSTPVSTAVVGHGAAGDSALAVLGRRFRVAGGPGRERRTRSTACPPATTAGRSSSTVSPPVPASRVYGGERLWWDLHPPRASARAVVGAFPEPFLHGRWGQRLPTTVACGSVWRAPAAAWPPRCRARACPAASQLLGGWLRARTRSPSRSRHGASCAGRSWRPCSQRGPATSGVYARLCRRWLARATRFERRRKRALHWPPRGLIAAIAQGPAAPTWLVLGTDAKSLLAAADALRGHSTEGRFALALSGGHYLPMPR